MKTQNKTLGLVFFSMLVLVLAAGFASAITLTLSSPETLNPFKSSTSFVINSDTIIDFTNTFPQLLIIKDNEDNEVTLSITPASNISGVNSAIFNAEVIGVSTNFNLGKYSASILINTVNSNDSTDNKSISVPLTFENTPNKNPNLGSNLEIFIDRISVDSGFGRNNQWFLLDEIEAKINVRNNGDDRIRRIVVEWGLYDLKNARWIVQGKESSFNLNDGDEITLTLEFKLDRLSRIDISNKDNYKFYVWATGEDAEFGEEKTSVYDLEDIELVIERDFVILDNIKFSDLVNCGESVQISADVVNIGTRDQDSVSVRLVNARLGINQEIIIGDMDVLDRESFEFLFRVPSEIEEGIYQIQVYVFDEDKVNYQNSFNNKKSLYTIPLRVSGSCVVSPRLIISANLESGGEAGEELIVKALIANTATNLRIFEVSASGYENWADLTSVSPNLLTLNAGETKEVLFGFNVAEEASGTKSFDIRLIENGNVILSQPVSVPIQVVEEPKGGFNFLTGNLVLGENWYLWGIGLVNVILFIIIIAVAVRLSRRKE